MRTCVFALVFLLAGCDALTTFHGRVRSAGGCGGAAAGPVRGASIVVDCARGEPSSAVSDDRGEFWVKRLSMSSGGCEVSADAAGYRRATVRPESSCDACAVEVPLTLECAAEPAPPIDP